MLRAGSFPGVLFTMCTDYTTLPFSLVRLDSESRASPSASCDSMKLDIFAEYIKYRPNDWLCQRICQLFLGVDIFDRDIALLNLLMKPIIFGKKMTVLSR